MKSADFYMKNSRFYLLSAFWVVPGSSTDTPSRLGEQASSQQWTFVTTTHA